MYIQQNYTALLFIFKWKDTASYNTDRKPRRVKIKNNNLHVQFINCLLFATELAIGCI